MTFPSNSHTQFADYILFTLFFKPRSGGSHRYMHSIYKESAAAAVDMSEIVKHAATLAALASRNFA